jgi:hypothetical protein
VASDRFLRGGEDARLVDRGAGIEVEVVPDRSRVAVRSLSTTRLDAMRKIHA